MHTIFGIRHHGPGSARSLRAELESLRPDAVLVEGPPDADALIPLAAHAGMSPPVALLLYLPDAPQKAVYYPFAEFSPEWQALLYALQAGIPVRFMDLAQAYQLSGNGQHLPEKGSPEIEPGGRPDPFTWVAEAAGYSDGERWWEHFVEQRRDSGQVFQGVLELMTALRHETDKDPLFRNDLAREAAMRTILREARADGYERIAVVCGAWHAPVLDNLENEKQDAALLKDLPGCEVAATWVPWTYDRLSRRSGYGAGIESPGWYEHLWLTQADLVEKWLVKVAQLMREEDLEVSPAHAIEGTRLAAALAALRERPLPGLTELDEAVQAIYCFGDDTPMRLIHEKLTVGVRMGSIPAEAPSVPLQRDLAAAQKRTRMEPSASPENLDLDLRKPLLLERSQLLHRLNLLGIPWGRLQTVHGARGTFHELWQVEWKPDFAVTVIEASLWGNTVLEAATNKTEHLAAQTSELPGLTSLVESALLADLAEAVPGLMTRVQQIAATSGDVPHLMEALPPLANVLRYGNVRQTDTSIVRQVVDELVARICIGLPIACSALDDEAAGSMFAQLNAVQNAIRVLQDSAHEEGWALALERLASQAGAHGLVRGRACRMLFDRAGSEEWIAARMRLALSPGTDTAESAAWVQGFLHGGGQALIHHPRLWRLVDEWAVSLPEAQFTAALPLLRRTFGTFPAPERRQIGEMARSGGRAAPAGGAAELDPQRVERALALVGQILAPRGKDRE